ncbi:VWA domain-containing protein [Haliangium sp. UPWRP_2]|uniref:VWA domain-containing protein n=1 Tax=Haliangium sp. UPWRP_2 TaxID=1931276 RepID=UPI000B546C7C|nr:VWA domain-containing protein [Haliangium sp. UPWRP_2]PSM31869.1 VWA domain-containing protein [Haliangium sp. UPWRP_2]
MQTAELPLLELFQRLRAADLPLGISDYRALLTALRGGHGLADREALRRLCRSLWAKSAEDARLVDWHFDRAIAAELALQGTRKDASWWRRLSRWLRGLREQIQKWWRSLFAAAPPALPAGMEQQPRPATASPLPVPLLLGRDGDEVQRAAQISSATSYKSPGGRRFFLRGDYYPLTRRQLQQSLRRLRSLRREGPPAELDIQATIDSWHRHGLLAAPVLVPLRRNRVELVLLIDCDGSMVPFHALVARLLDAAQRGAHFRRVETYYFHNTPEEHLYRTRHLQDPASLDTLLADWAARQPAVAVVSDGGAARGGLRPARVADCARFLARLGQKVRRIVWLNPMPRARWTHTTAAEIAACVPMFEMSRAGIDRAVEVLRGGSQQEVGGPSLPELPR